MVWFVACWLILWLVVRLVLFLFLVGRFFVFSVGWFVEELHDW
jgi:hypothetical protein